MIATPNIIAYPIGDKLYVNLTNRCTNACTFCVRTTTDCAIEGYNLWLDEEPSVAQAIEDIKNKKVETFKELVFCGYGEPTERFDDCMYIAEKIKEYCQIKVRINTNGHANAIAGHDVTPLLSGRVDVLSISLNAPNAKEYNEICQCKFGEDGFYAMLDFAKKAKAYVPKVVLSIVDIMPKGDKEKCAQLCDEIGVQLRVRELIK